MSFSALLCSVPFRTFLAFLHVTLIGYVCTGDQVFNNLTGFSFNPLPARASPPPLPSTARRPPPRETPRPSPRTFQQAGTLAVTTARRTAEGAAILHNDPPNVPATPPTPTTPLPTTTTAAAARQVPTIVPAPELRLKAMLTWPGQAGFRLRMPVTSDSGVDEAYFLAAADSPGARPSPMVLLSPAECNLLDAKLTGMQCFEADDPGTQERCRNLHTACTLRHFDQAEIQRDFPLYPPSCAPPERGATCVPAYTAKFFKESLGSGHLDERWARRLTPTQQQQALRPLFGAWVAFTQERGLRYWLFGGGLIGWFFNKELLPWDDDLDVQVLASDLLSQTYQQYNGVTYKDRYYFEINPNSVHRAPEGKNFIDARFIDKETGVFIDVVAVSYNLETQALQCKHGESFIPAHIFPIRKTTFMGEEAWVPYDVPRFLLKKYGPRVMLHQQPQHHPTSRCPPFGPCAVYQFHSEELMWVDQRARVPQ